MLVVTDPYLSGTEPVARVLEALKRAAIEAVLFDQVRVEPTDQSFRMLRHRTGGCRTVRRLCRRGWRLEHGHGEGGEPVRDLSRGVPRLRQSPDRTGASGPRQAEAADRGADHGRDGERDDGVAIFDYTPLHAKTGIAHRSSGRCWA